MDGPKDLERLTRLIREKVEETLQKETVGEVERIELATFLWAACKALWAQEGVAQIPEEWRPPRVVDLEAASRLLRNLGPTPSSTDLYRTLVSVLRTVESSIDPAAAPPVTPVSLAKLQPDPPLLEGSVQVWFRECSPFRKARHDPAAEAAPIPEVDRAMRYRLEPERHLQSLTFLLGALDQPKAKLLPRQGEREGPLWNPLLRSMEVHAESSLRIALCPLQGPWLPRFNIVEADQEMKFFAQPRIFEEAPGALEAHLDQILQEVADQSIRILVFPELSIDAELRESLRKKLRELRNNKLLAVLGGTFHVGPESGPYRNEAVVWDGRGEPLWAQNKQGLFRLEPDAAWKGRHFFPDLKERPQTSLVEGIQRGGELVVVDAYLARLAILICADALEPEGYKEILHRVQPDFVFILAMSPKTVEFDKERKWLVGQDIGTLFVNAACICREDLGDELVFIDLSLQEGRHSLPTRWRWPIGHDPEWYRQHAPGNPWRPLEELAAKLTGEGQESPVRLMAGRAGLILDLGLYLRERGENHSGRGPV